MSVIIDRVTLECIYYLIILAHGLHMEGRKKTITISVKLFTGLDQIAKTEEYDPLEGVTMTIPKGTRVKKAMKMLGLSNRGSLIFFMNGERVGPRKKLKDGDEIDCFRPVAGG